MKKLLFVFGIMLTVLSVHAQQKDVKSIIKQTCAKAAQQNKKAFIIFHASWCVWCHKLDSSMNDASCKDFFNNNYVTEHITVFEEKSKAVLHNPGGEAFLADHHAKEQGIPAWFIFDANGNVVADSQLRPDSSNFNVEGVNVGCPSNEQEINYFISVLKKTSNINLQQESTIRKRFALNNPI